MKRVCVVIPTYNEAKAIAGIVREVKAQGLDVVVIDDGSADKTAEIAKASGAIVLANPKNKGKGTSLIMGFQHALNCGFDAVIAMDGDGQHLPEDIPLFLRAAQDTNSQIIVGDRMPEVKNMPWVRVLTNRFMSCLISKITKQKIPDTQCGFRLIKREALEKLELKTANYEIESEMLIKAARLGYKIDFVAIKTVYEGEKSQINPLVDTVRFIKFIIQELWTTIS